MKDPQHIWQIYTLLKQIEECPLETLLKSYLNPPEEQTRTKLPLLYWSLYLEQTT